MSHPLGEYVIADAANMECSPAEIEFDISNHPTRISMVDKLRGQSGWMRLEHLRIDSFDREEYLLFSGFNDAGANLDQETCEKMFNCRGLVKDKDTFFDMADNRLQGEAQRHVQATIVRSLEENNQHFNEARNQLDKWAEDMELAAQKELDDNKRQIRELQRLNLCYLR